MAQTTKKGRELMLSCYKTYGIPNHYQNWDWFDTQEIASLIARHATTYAKIQEGHCNGHPAMGNPHIEIKRANELQERFEKRLYKREAQIEGLINELAKGLLGVKAVSFEGDPRGHTVALVFEDGRTVGVPGS